MIWQLTFRFLKLGVINSKLVKQPVYDGRQKNKPLVHVMGEKFWACTNRTEFNLTQYMGSASQMVRT